jgi:hypothetical protein
MRLGDLDALKEALKSGCEWCADANTNWCEHCCKINDFEDLIDDAPTVELKRVKNELNNELNELRPQGEWELHGMIYYCSKCGHECGESGDNFCGNCGADMRGDKEK